MDTITENITWKKKDNVIYKHAQHNENVVTNIFQQKYGWICAPKSFPDLSNLLN